MAKKVGCQRATSRRRCAAVGGTRYQRAAQLKLFGEVAGRETTGGHFTQRSAMYSTTLRSWEMNR